MHGINHLVINLRIEQGAKTICNKVDVGGRYIAKQFRERQPPGFNVVLRRIGFRHLSIARQSPGLDRHHRRANGQHRSLTQTQDHQSQRYQAIPPIFCLKPLVAFKVLLDVHGNKFLMNGLIIEAEREKPKP